MMIVPHNNFMSISGGLDLILLPGVAFSRAGGRMGHGMGYYDKYLAEMFAANPQRKSLELNARTELKLEANKTILLGLALNEQIVNEAELPLDEHDIILDQIVTSV